MNSINFTAISYENFNAVGSTPVEIQLDKSPQTILVGKNGSGKSSVIAAIIYVLFNKAYNGEALTSLVNTFNKKKMLVNLSFEAKGKEYLVIRGQKPNVFEIYEDDVLIKSEAAKKDYQKYLEGILGFDYTIFNHTIGLTKEKYKPFFKLSVGDRRVLIEEILGLTMFSSMNTIVKQHIKEDETLKVSLSHKIQVLEIKLEGLENVVEREKQNNDKEVQGLSKEIIDKQEDITFKESMLDDVRSDIETTKVKIFENKELERKINSIKLDVNQLNKEIVNINKDINFYHNNSFCPTCRQSIDEANEEVSKVLSGFGDDVSTKQFEIEKLSKEALVLLGSVDKLSDTFFKEKSEELFLGERNLYSLNNEVSKLKRRVKDLINASESSVVVQKDESGIKTLQLEILTANGEYEVLLHKIARYNGYHKLLRDQGVKSKIISTYIPKINSRFTKYLTSMGYNISVSIDSMFKVTIRTLSGVDRTFGSLSSGQKTRMDLAMLFTLLDVARERNSVSCNLLFVDEILENLDLDGSYLVTDLIKQHFGDKNIFIATQRATEFREMIRSEVEFKLNPEGFTEINRNGE